MPGDLSLDEIEQKLSYLGKSATRIARGAMLAGAKVLAIKQQAAADAAITGGKGTVKRTSTGAMKRSIAARTIKASAGTVGAKSGFDVGRRKKDADPSTGAIGHHGHLFVGGTVRRETGSERVRIGRKVLGRKLTGKHVMNRGIMPANQPSFIKTAADAARSEVEAVIHDSLVRGIARAVDRLGG